MEYDACDGDGIRTESISLEDGEKYEDVIKQCRPKCEIICPKCLGSKYREKTRCSEKMCGQCTSCSRFYPLPNNLKDWCIYYWRELKQFYYIKKYNISYKIYKLIYRIFLSKNVFSIIGDGDVIRYRALWTDEGWGKFSESMKNDDIPNKLSDVERDKIYELKVSHIRIDFDPYNHKRPFKIVNGYTDINSNFIWKGDLGIEIVDINGSKSYVNLMSEFPFIPNWFSKRFLPKPSKAEF